MTAQQTVGAPNLNHYSVLGLSPPRDAQSPTYSLEDIKQAYHRALLIHHPDKLKHDSSAAGPSIQIDHIVAAYQCLSQPDKRLSYDAHLLKQQRLANRATLTNGIGLEPTDLEELDYDESTARWTQQCRCGGQYQVDESELEQSASEGEIVLNCSSCSLCIRVTYATLNGLGDGTK